MFRLSRNPGFAGTSSPADRVWLFTNPVNQYRLDFAIIRGDTRLDVEVDGELYHKEWDGARCKEDIIRDIRLSSLGWQIKRFWVYRIRDEMDECVNEVIAALQSQKSEKE